MVKNPAFRKQSTSNLLMVRPVSFGFNPDTSDTNSFQSMAISKGAEGVSQKAWMEFDAFISLLKANHINVMVVDDTPAPPKPDAVFPNNWLTMSHDGTITLFPMAAKNRRPERRDDILMRLKADFEVNRIHDLSNYENSHQYLEGTGSMVFDHIHNLAYACISQRTNPELFREYCHQKDYIPIVFTATDKKGNPIYHTNVMMCIGSNVAIICGETIRDDNEWEMVLENLQATNHEVLDISFEQMSHFAGNMLEVENSRGDHFMVMSTRAYEGLDHKQIQTIERHLSIIHSPINTIETIGGGSARCMMVEIFLPEK